MNQLQEIAVQTVFDGLTEILYKLSGDSVIENIETIDKLIELHNALYEAFPNEIKLPNEVEFDDSTDGDAESALASAGWGVDESYGGNEEHL